MELDKFMIVRVRFGRGNVVARRKGKNSRIATLVASLLTIGSVSCASLGVWRVGGDLGWTGDFVFTQGLLSHWQVWMGAAAAIQYGAWRLTQYARLAVPEPSVQEPQQDTTSGPQHVAANV